MKLVIHGRIPSKKNNKQMVYVRGKRFLIPSKNHKEWHEAAMWEVKSQRPKLDIEKCEVELIFFMPDNRATDLSNKAESVMDLLVDLKVIKDDKWQVVSALHLISAGIDKKDPRVEIEISTD